MVRLLLLIAMVSLIASPTARARIQPHVGRLLDPVYEWSVRSRVGEIARRLESERASGRPLPAYQGLGQFLRHAYAREDAAVDAWDTPFFLTRDTRGLRVGSAGPDRRKHTADDILSPPLAERRAERGSGPRSIAQVPPGR